MRMEIDALKQKGNGCPSLRLKTENKGQKRKLGGIIYVQ